VPAVGGNAEVELLQSLRVEENIDLGDLPVRDGDAITENTWPGGVTTAPACARSRARV